MSVFIILILLRLLDLIRAQPITIYIDSSSNYTEPDGSKSLPYNSFAQAFDSSIRENIKFHEISVIFLASNVPYPLSMSLLSRGNISSNYSLLLTSDQGQYISSLFDCSEYPRVELQGDGFGISANDLKVSLSFLNIYIIPGNAAFAFDIHSNNKLNLNYNNVCINCRREPNSPSLGILNVKNGGVSQVTLNKVSIFSNNQNLIYRPMFFDLSGDSIVTIADFYIDIQTTFDSANSISSLFYFLGSNSRTQSIALNNFTFEGTFNLTAINNKNPETVILTFQNISYIFLENINLSQITSDVGLTAFKLLEGSTFRIENLYSSGMSCNKNASCNLVSTTSRDEALDLYIRNLSLLDSSQIRLLWLASPVSNFFAQDILIDGSNDLKSSIISLMFYYNKSQHQIINYPTIQNLVIRNSALSCLLFNVSFVDPASNVFVDLAVPPYQLVLDNITIKNNILDHSIIPPLLFRIADVSLLIQNSLFTSNTWNHVTMFGDHTEVSNIYLVNNRFINETFKNSNLIYVDYTSPPQDQFNKNMIYRLLLIQNCTFQNMNIDRKSVV